MVSNLTRFFEKNIRECFIIIRIMLQWYEKQKNMFSFQKQSVLFSALFRPYFIRNSSRSTKLKATKLDSFSLSDLRLSNHSISQASIFLTTLLNQLKTVLSFFCLFFAKQTVQFLKVPFIQYQIQNFFFYN